MTLGRLEGSRGRFLNSQFQVSVKRHTPITTKMWTVVTGASNPILIGCQRFVLSTAQQSVCVRTLRTTGQPRGLVLLRGVKGIVPDTVGPQYFSTSITQYSPQ